MHTESLSLEAIYLIDVSLVAEWLGLITIEFFLNPNLPDSDLVKPKSHESFSLDDTLDRHLEDHLNCKVRHSVYH